MKLTEENIVNASTAQLNDWVDENLMAGYFTTANDLPKWSSDLTDAMKVLDTVKEKIFYIHKSLKVGWVVSIGVEVGECSECGEDEFEVHHQGVSVNLAEAICKAALLAVTAP